MIAEVKGLFIQTISIVLSWNVLGILTKLFWRDSFI